MMKEQLTERLEKLKGEFASGQKMLADLEARQANLQQTLLRISGAIQVLEELLAQGSQAAPEETGSTPRPASKIDAAA
jgi:predicted nuclease with TOPRIM domain